MTLSNRTDAILKNDYRELHSCTQNEKNRFNMTKVFGTKVEHALGKCSVYCGAVQKRILNIAVNELMVRLVR